MDAKRSLAAKKGWRRRKEKEAIFNLFYVWCKKLEPYGKYSEKKYNEEN